MDTAKRSELPLKGCFGFEDNEEQFPPTWIVNVHLRAAGAIALLKAGLIPPPLPPPKGTACSAKARS